MDGGGKAPVSLVNVTCIPKQYLVLGQLGGGPLARDQDGEWEGELPDTPISSGSFHHWVSTPTWPLSGACLQTLGLLSHWIWWPLT